MFDQKYFNLATRLIRQREYTLSKFARDTLQSRLNSVKIKEIVNYLLKLQNHDNIYYIY